MNQSPDDRDIVERYRLTKTLAIEWIAVDACGAGIAYSRSFREYNEYMRAKHTNIRQQPIVLPLYPCPPPGYNSSVLARVEGQFFLTYIAHKRKLHEHLEVTGPRQLQS